MSAPTSLIQLLLSLLSDPKVAQEFQQNPDAFLANCGLTELTPQDVHDALVLVQDNDDASFERHHHTGGNHVHHVTPPPPPAPPAPGESHHEAAVKYLNTYITNNYIDDRDTIVDNSINQQIDTGGGDFRQHIDIDAVTASGDGAVAAGGDIRDSNVVTGNGNVVGEDNQVVSGDGNTTAFGSGDATSASFEDVSVSGGGAISVGGNATGNYDATGSFNQTTNTTTNSTDISDSGNHYTDIDVSASYEDNHVDTTDSGNTTHVGSYNHAALDVDVS